MCRLSYANQGQSLAKMDCLDASLQAFMRDAGEQGVLLVSLGTIAELGTTSTAFSFL